MIIEKNTTPKEDEFYEFFYYVARIQRQFINTKKRWFKARYPNHNPVMEELDIANSIMRLIDLKRKGLQNVFSVILDLLIFHVMLFMPWACLQPNKTPARPGGKYLYKALLNFYYL